MSKSMAKRIADQKGEPWPDSPPDSRRGDDTLTGLIAKLNDHEYFHDVNQCPYLGVDERDEIVKWLRVGRLMKARVDHAALWLHSDGRIMVDDESLLDTIEPLTLDEAEEHFGIGLTTTDGEVAANEVSNRLGPYTVTVVEIGATAKREVGR